MAIDRLAKIDHAHRGIVDLPRRRIETATSDLVDQAVMLGCESLRELVLREFIRLGELRVGGPDDGDDLAPEVDHAVQHWVGSAEILGLNVEYTAAILDIGVETIDHTYR